MPRGRVRTFDTNVALDQAIELFWRQGYEATSIADLTEAMGISPPSLYSAFGNKRQLFDKVVEKYGTCRSHYLQAALAEPTGRDAARRLMLGVVDGATLDGHPSGCLFVQGALACADENVAVQKELAGKRDDTRLAMQLRFEQAVLDGDFPPDTDIVSLARYLATVLDGINVQAGAGASPAELLAAVDLAMLAFPGR